MQVRSHSQQNIHVSKGEPDGTNCTFKRGMQPIASCSASIIQRQGYFLTQAQGFPTAETRAIEHLLSASAKKARSRALTSG